MRSLILLILVFAYSTSFAEVIVIEKDFSSRSIGKSVSYLKDVKGNYSINQVIKYDKENKFLKSTSDFLNFGNSDATYWVKVSYTNKTTEDIFLIVDISIIEKLDFYAEDSNGNLIKISSGSMMPVNQKVITANNYIFSLPKTDQENQIKTAYLRLKTDNILFVPLKIASADQLISGINISDRFEAMGVGILMCLLLFNISVYIKSRDLTYLYYSIRIFALFCFYILYFRGYSYLLGDDFRFYINMHPHIFLGIGSVAGIAFSYRFLDLKETFPASVIIIKTLIAAWVIVIILSVFGLKIVASDIAHFLLAITTSTLLGLGIAAYRKGVKVALYYVISWSFICLTTAWMVLCLEGILPYSESSFHLFPLGFIFELLLLSLALGDRLKEMKKSKKQIQKDKLKIQEENIYLISSQNERLEKIVESRTRALKKLVQSLESANADKTRIFSIIAHDLRSPFNSLISLFSLNDMDLLTFDDVKLLLHDSRKSVDNIHNTLNNLLYWAQSQMKGLTTTPSRFNMRVLVEDLMLVYQPLIKKKDITTEILIIDDTDVFADLNQMSLVMRNLIDNAIKFTPLGNSIQIKISGDESHIIVDVRNAVSAALDIEKLILKDRNEPSYGTSNERGVGLGLHLCQDFIEKNNGVFHIRKEGQYVVLGFNISKYIIDPLPNSKVELLSDV